ncbi:hypothetical protein [Streptomyces sp. Tue6028]|uniref:hypothetical protein n=1 Tax=Streptomyces sp. Tue6028 TaxID=2036037 RepID=UPI003D75D463
MAVAKSVPGSGAALVTAERARREGPLRKFVDDLHSGQAATRRVPGTAVFLRSRSRRIVAPATRPDATTDRRR